MCFGEYFETGSARDGISSHLIYVVDEDAAISEDLVLELVHVGGNCPVDLLSPLRLDV